MTAASRVPSHVLSIFARRIAACTCTALLLASSAAFAQGTNNEEGYGGTFNAPGYPSVNGRNAAPATLPGGGSALPPNPAQPGLNNNANPNALPGQRVQPQTPGLRGEFERGVRRFEPPPKPSEFQKFVEAATGRMLPVFGQRFFSEAQDTGFGALDNVPVPADYVVGPGDEVMVRAWGSIDVDYRTTVDRNGLLNLPKIGSFNVAGVKASELERHLRAQIGRLYTNFNLNVTLGQLRGIKVFVVGPAQRPGVYTLPSQSSMLSAAVAAGGPGPNGSMRHLLLRRDGRTVSELDVYDFLVSGDKSRDVQLVAGDVVVFQSVGPRVALTGALDTQAIYELKSAEEPLSAVLRYAGGAPVLANPNRAQLERIDPMQAKAARSVEQFKLDAAGLAQPLRDGDVLTLLEISPQFANAVTLKGHVAQPLRYAWTPGMRIRDLIPDKEALISPDFYRRKNLLVQMIDEDESTSDRRSRERALEFQRSRGLLRDERQPRDRSSSPDSAEPDTRMAPNDYTEAQGTAPAYAREPQRLDINGVPITPTPRARRDERRTRYGEPRDEMEGPLARRTPTPLFEELNWDYAVIERLNKADLSTQVIPFNLGAAVLRGDPAANVELQPGDVVTIYSQKDIRVPVARQTRLVSIEGEVGAPGVYQLEPGETMRQLIARAGGFTPQAYVYGLEFSREAARARQRENLSAAITRLQALSATQAARDAANRRDDPGGASSAAVSQAATQAQLARLARLQPNGRIALELDPQDRTLASVPDLPLENGDRIIVPPRPGFVTVAGAVVNSNAFVWKPERTVGDYLRIAGLDESSETDYAFILRADGTVTSAQDRRGVFGFGGGLLAATLYPGDAVIVPNQLDYETWGRFLIRNLKDWSQIFSGFGIGIAAIHSLNN
jgi:protein involved in polysaccharide export with SLBB domain